MVLLQRNDAGAIAAERVRARRNRDAVNTQSPEDDAHLADASPYAPPRADVARRTVVVEGGRVVHAGFWKRAAAMMIDATLLLGVGFVVSIVCTIVFGMTGLSTNDMAYSIVDVLLNLAIGTTYYAMMHASAQQATLGKMAIGIKVARPDGQPIGLARGIGRYFAQFLSALVLAIGYLMAAFTTRRQALHDRICDTIVVDRHAFTEHPEWQREDLGAVTILVLCLSSLLLVALAVIIASIGATLLGEIPG